MFSDNEINTGRQDELDIVKGLAIIFMVWCHVYRELGADTTTLPGIMVDSILGGPFAAPMFMICMGVGICFSRNQEPKQFFARGFKLVVLGYVLNLFRFVILQAVVYAIKGNKIVWRDLLCELIFDAYSVELDHPFAMDDVSSVYRHTDNRKWFALTMRIPYRTLGISKDGDVDVLNIKCDPILIGSLRGRPGFLPAYHMNKDKWITILLDGSVDSRGVAGSCRF